MRHISQFSFRISFGRATFLLALFVVFGILIGYSIPAFAQSDFGIAEVDSQIGLSGRSIVLILVNVIRILLGFLGLILVIMIIYAGYMIMVSAGDEEKITKGKTILKNAIIGTAIILFSFIIVQFIINILSGVTGLNYDQKQPPGIETFAGIGSLGGVIKDHFPMQNQTNVYRNTKIAITFTESIDPHSIIENTNMSCWGPDDVATTTCVFDGNNAVKNPYYGDCINGVCDTLKTDVFIVNRLKTKGGVVDGDVIVLDALVAYQDGKEAHTFVFKLRGQDLFGNDTANQWHKVEVTNLVKNKDGKGIFENYLENSYKWEFETNTEVDLSPPYVVDVSPNPGEIVEKNRILKITFNEAVDPMTVQGVLDQNSSFSNIIVAMNSGDTKIVPVYPANTNKSIYGLYSKGVFSEAGNIILDIIVDGVNIFVAYASKIVKLDATDPTKLVSTGSSFSGVSGGTSRSMAVDSMYLYVVGGGPTASKGTLHIIDKKTMKEVGKMTDLANPQSIALMGEYAYVADYDKGIRIIKISNPQNPTLTGTLNNTGVTYLYKVAIYNGKLYFGQRVGQQFGVADLSDPINPKIISQVILGQTPSSIVFFGNTAYVAVKSGGVKIIDISDPKNNGMPVQQFVPQQYGAKGAGAISLAIYGNILAVGEQYAIKLFDIGEDSKKPSFIASFPGVGESLLEIDNFRPVSFGGEYLYAGYKGKGVLVFDTVLQPEESSVNTEDTKNSIKSIDVQGQWKITNGYKTIEFLSSKPCGNNAINSCGEPIYCLPTSCADYDKKCTVNYSVLARTASLKDAQGTSFVSAGIFDGVVDMADNAMDSSLDLDNTGSVFPGSYDNQIYEFKDSAGKILWRHKPPFSGTKKNMSVAELYPDNYWWNFIVVNDIDSTSPYVRHVDPGIDNQGVSSFKPVDVYFSKEMSILSLSNISIIEYPNSGIGLGYAHIAKDIEEKEIVNGISKTVTQTVLNIIHPSRPFGPGKTDYWYFTKIPGSEVKAMNQFCLYPGRGPYSTVPQQGKSNPECKVTYNGDWNIIGVKGCIPGNVTITSSTDTGCASVYTGLPQVMVDTNTCIKRLSDPKISKSVFVQ